MTLPNEFEHTAKSVSEIRRLIAGIGAEMALLKILPKNANDKNQIYIASDFGVLYELFDLTLAERGASVSESKSANDAGSRITEASFNQFHWLKSNGSLVEARRVKAIIYPQYPEARLSGFQTFENTMPQSLSVAFTKAVSDLRRLLVLAKLPKGQCIGIVFVDLSDDLLDELARLPGFERARACKKLEIDQGNSVKLEKLLRKVIGIPMRGCRLDAYGASLPFAGTQVCGYTLEHALGIIPNSDMDGDLFGIELKTHTQVKVTLFTPEPDGGHYYRDFADFMKTYGYLDSAGDYRLTGIHRADVLCTKSGLTLKVREKRFSNGRSAWFPYDPTTPLTAKMDGVEVALIDSDGEVAASWSLARLMNCWGAKHNEAVYIQASKVVNPNSLEAAEGYEHVITFGENVMWCRDTSAEKLLLAISKGTIYLDPAPKLHASEPRKNKRRSQWRVNDITKAAKDLYSVVEFKDISSSEKPVPLGLKLIESRPIGQKEIVFL